MTIAEPFTPKIRPHFMGERRVVIHNLTWAAYRQIQEAIGEQRSIRLLFDQGTLEIIMPLEEHETARERISLFIRNWVIFMGLKLKTMGSTTLDREDLNRGVEPDNAFYIQNQSQVAKRIVDLTKDPPPDLVLEVDITHTDIDKNRLYATLGVPEFWRYNGETLIIYQLRGDSYQEVVVSPTFPLMQKEDLYQFLKQCKEDEVNAEMSLRHQIQSQIIKNTSS
ncbi:MAG: Uma2 family endonuclease [Synechococcaceae cyanobacterium SM2_3_1]|nr:Uma2 family endonuclease [Synechococcaceae cyanobacterium SM2_3_1]